MSGGAVSHGAVDCRVLKNPTEYATPAAALALLYAAFVWMKVLEVLIALMHRAQWTLFAEALTHPHPSLWMVVVVDTVVDVVVVVEVRVVEVTVVEEVGAPRAHVATTAQTITPTIGFSTDGDIFVTRGRGCEVLL
jgi:magnesium-transporting ATPase (P-type)